LELYSAGHRELLEWAVITIEEVGDLSEDIMEEIREGEDKTVEQKDEVAVEAEAVVAVEVVVEDVDES